LLHHYISRTAAVLLFIFVILVAILLWLFAPEAERGRKNHLFPLKFLGIIFKELFIVVQEILTGAIQSCGSTAHRTLNLRCCHNIDCSCFADWVLRDQHRADIEDIEARLTALRLEYDELRCHTGRYKTERDEARARAKVAEPVAENCHQNHKSFRAHENLREQITELQRKIGRLNMERDRRSTELKDIGGMGYPDVRIRELENAAVRIRDENRVIRGNYEHTIGDLEREVARLRLDAAKPADSIKPEDAGVVVVLRKNLADALAEVRTKTEVIRLLEVKRDLPALESIKRDRQELEDRVNQSEANLERVRVQFAARGRLAESQLRNLEYLARDGYQLLGLLPPDKVNLGEHMLHMHNRLMELQLEVRYRGGDPLQSLQDEAATILRRQIDDYRVQIEEGTAREDNIKLITAAAQRSFAALQEERNALRAQVESLGERPTKIYLRAKDLEEVAQRRLDIHNQLRFAFQFIDMAIEYQHSIYPDLDLSNYAPIKREAVRMRDSPPKELSPDQLRDSIIGAQLAMSRVIRGIRISGWPGSEPNFQELPIGKEGRNEAETRAFTLHNLLIEASALAGAEIDTPTGSEDTKRIEATSPAQDYEDASEERYSRW